MKRKIIAILLAATLALGLAACGGKAPDPCANGHDWGEWVTITEATETADGLKERECRKCDEKDSDTIPKTGSGTTELTPEQTVAKMREIIGGTLDAVMEEQLYLSGNPSPAPQPAPTSLLAFGETDSGAPRYRHSEFETSAVDITMAEVVGTTILAVSAILLEQRGTEVTEKRYTITPAVGNALEAAIADKIAPLSARSAEAVARVSMLVALMEHIELFGLARDGNATYGWVGIDAATANQALRLNLPDRVEFKVWNDGEGDHGMTLYSNSPGGTTDYGDGSYGWSRPSKAVESVSSGAERRYYDLGIGPRSATDDEQVEEIYYSEGALSGMLTKYVDRQETAEDAAGAALFARLMDERTAILSAFQAEFADFPAKTSTIEWTFA